MVWSFKSPNFCKEELVETNCSIHSLQRTTEFLVLDKSGFIGSEELSNRSRSDNFFRKKELDCISRRIDPYWPITSSWPILS
jgi:hypothetical protein